MEQEDNKMYYKTCKRDQSRTSEYVGSTNNPYDADVEEVRKDIARHNRQVKANYEKWGRTNATFIKLRVRPRGPRRPHSYDTLLKDARYFDIYKTADTTRTYNMKSQNK
jgi:hypothetical protein